MDDIAKPARDERPVPIQELERALNEGIDDLDAGRTVSREQSRREIDALLRSRKSKKPPAA